MLKGGLDPKGHLFIERAGKIKTQCCCFKHSPDSKQPFYCSDLCAHFGEPLTDGRKATLTLCLNHKLVFDVFEDRRHN